MVSGSVRLSNPASSTVAPTSNRPSLRGMRYTFGDRTTCRSKFREGNARQSIWPFTGRVGNAIGAIIPAHAPAQLTTLWAENDVLTVFTPATLLFDWCTPSTASPDEKSTPRFFAVLIAAAVSACGSTLRSFT